MSGFLDLLKDPRYVNQIATGLDTAGGFMTTAGYLQHGAAARGQAQFTAEQLRQQAGDAMASAQRRAFSDDRQARYIQSETLARAAASGGGASDPTVVNIMAQQAEEGAYRRQVDLYEGSSRERLLQLQAQAKEFEGQQTQDVANRVAGSSMLKVGASLLRGFAKDSSILSRFGGDGPNVGPQDIQTWSGY